MYLTKKDIKGSAQNEAVGEVSSMEDRHQRDGQDDQQSSPHLLTHDVTVEYF